MGLKGQGILSGGCFGVWRLSGSRNEGGAATPLNPWTCRSLCVCWECLSHGRSPGSPCPHRTSAGSTENRKNPYFHSHETQALTNLNITRSQEPLGSIGMEKRCGSKPFSIPSKTNPLPLGGEGRALAATQRCPAGTARAGTPEQGQPGRGHPIRDPPPNVGIPLQTLCLPGLQLQDPPPSSGIPAPGFPLQTLSPQGFPLRDSLSSSSILRVPRFRISPQPLCLQGFPAPGSPFQTLYPQEFSSRLCPRESLFRNPPRASPSTGIPAQGFLLLLLHPQGSLLRDPRSGPSILRNPLQPLWGPLQPPRAPQGTASPSPPTFLFFPQSHKSFPFRNSRLPSLTHIPVWCLLVSRRFQVTCIAWDLTEGFLLEIGIFKLFFPIP